MRYLQCLLLILFFLNSGCASTYKPVDSGPGSGGYEDLKLSSNIFRISFRGNGLTNKSTASDLALLRSAEVAASNGFKYFVVSESVHEDDHETASHAVSSMLSNPVFSVPNPKKPRSTYTIICHEKRPETNSGVYDAQDVIQSLGKKYNAVIQKPSS
jgi:hypothetical protein